MREDLPLVSYERGMNHNYMVLGRCDFFGAAKDNSRDYRVRMLLENKIQGLLPITHRQVNGESKYYYEINSLQSLDRMIEKNALKYHELRAVLLGCINLFERLEEYLLNGEQIIMKPDFIYVNVESMEPYFVCYPDYTGNVRNSFMELVDVLLAHIDHTDQQAVMLGYQVYRYTRNPNYVLNGICKFMECTITDTSEKADYYRAENYSKKAEELELGGKAEDSSVMPKLYEAYENNDDDNDCGAYSRRGSIKELIGGIFCLLIALCAGAAIFGARVLHCYKLSDDNELYMYGAAAMALAAAALFFICYAKTARQNREIEELNEDDEENVYEVMIKKDIVNNLTSVNGDALPDRESCGTSNLLPQSNETVCLGNEMLEERMLRGRINGKEVNVPLGSLPLTVGKLGSVSDFIINDSTVSKMHARFEEREGRVCVCDLNSTNGTVHNGRVIAINTPVPLEVGDTLRFGRSCFTYF